MRKKAISMILAAALGSALLAGCSSAPKETTAAATTAETTAEEKKEESKAEETKAEEKKEEADAPLCFRKAFFMAPHL